MNRQQLIITLSSESPEYNEEALSHLLGEVEIATYSALRSHADVNIGTFITDVPLRETVEDVWSEHPTWTRDDWITDVGNGDTHIGYWEWVDGQIDDMDN